MIRGIEQASEEQQQRQQGQAIARGPVAATSERDRQRDHQRDRDLARVVGDQRRQVVPGRDAGIACQVRQRPPQLLRMSDDRQAAERVHERSGRGEVRGAEPRRAEGRGERTEPAAPARGSQQGRGDREEGPRLVDDRQRQRHRRQRRPVIGGEQHGRDGQHSAEDLLRMADEDRVEDRRHAHAKRDDRHSGRRRAPPLAHASGEPQSERAGGEQALERAEPEDRHRAADEQLAKQRPWRPQQHRAARPVVGKQVEERPQMAVQQGVHRGGERQRVVAAGLDVEAEPRHPHRAERHQRQRNGTCRGNSQSGGGSASSRSGCRRQTEAGTSRSR